MDENEQKQSDKLTELGSDLTRSRLGNIYTLTIIGQVEGHQGLEDLLRISPQSLGGVEAAEIVFIVFVKVLPAGDLGLLHQPDSVGFLRHFYHRG